ncbi:MAG TPA: citramalate synthase [Polyangiales bacterium]|nr:citramalate synthase [Polyangiales bacterium]
MPVTVILYDTSLRDGTQGEGVQLSVSDKLKAARLIEELGISYIEGGWPGSNPRDEAFFQQAKSLKLKHAKLTAFGSTRRAGIRCEQDSNLQMLVAADVPAITIFGKCWKLHAIEALRITPEENLELIEDSVRYLKARTGEVIFDAEHFFDGYADDPSYALAALRAAQSGGADYLTLCDTNGGTMPHKLFAAVQHVLSRLSKPIGIHTHNDSEMAVANSLTAVQAGARMVQGTINGWGERCGNANLVSIIPALKLKLGVDCLTTAQLTRLRHVSRSMDELANRAPWSQQPYVGQSAFAHKGGVHVDAVRKNSRTYEHIEPESVGNERRILVSDLSGRANVEMKALELGFELDPRAPETRAIVTKLKDLENQGYQFETAGASFKLMIDEALGRRPRFFKLKKLTVSADIEEDHFGSIGGSDEIVANLEIEVGGKVASIVSTGNGPVHAMDKGLRSLLDRFYPTLKAVRLVDYKVRVLSSGDGTGSVVRVMIQSSDGDEVWDTVGVSPNVIHASWDAMVDALEYKLVKDKVEPQGVFSERRSRISSVHPTSIAKG